LKYREQAKQDRLFTEQPRSVACTGYLINPIGIEHSPAQGNVADGGALFSLPDQRVDQRPERYLSPVIQILADLQGAMRDITLIIGFVAGARSRGFR